MSLVIKNTSSFLSIIDGIEIPSNSTYLVKSYEQETILQSRELSQYLFIGDCLLYNDTSPQTTFTGNNAVQSYLMAQVTNDVFIQNLSESVQALDTHTHTTTQITEGDNLYYTDERVAAHPEIASLREDLTEEQIKTKYGDVVGGNYTQIDSITGQLSFFGNARPWKNLELTQSTMSNTANQAPFGLLQDSGLTYIDKGLHFDKDLQQYAFIPAHNDFSFHQQSFSIGFWIEPHEQNKYILAKKNEVWAIELKGKHIKVDLSKNGSLKSENELNWLQRNCVVITFSDNGEEVKVDLYINGQKDNSIKFNNQISDLINGEIYIGCEAPGKNHYHGVLDELRFWSTDLDSSSISSFYNTGKGTDVDILPNETVASYHFNEGTGSVTACATGNPQFDMQFATGQEPTWVDGLLINSGNVSGGIQCPWFFKDVEQELLFTSLIDSTYVVNSDLKVVARVVPTAGVTGNVVFGIEYSWVNENAVFSNTTTVEQTLSITTSGKQHIPLSFPDIIGTGKGKNSLLSVRFYRKSSSSLDNYNEKIGFLNLLVSYQCDRL